MFSIHNWLIAFFAQWNRFVFRQYTKYGEETVEFGSFPFFFLLLLSTQVFRPSYACWCMFRKYQQNSRYPSWREPDQSNCTKSNWHIPLCSCWKLSEDVGPEKVLNTSRRECSLGGCLCIDSKVVHMKQSVKCFFFMVVSITWAKYRQVTDQLIPLWWLLR